MQTIPFVRGEEVSKLALATPRIQKFYSIFFKKSWVSRGQVSPAGSVGVQRLPLANNTPLAALRREWNPQPERRIFGVNFNSKVDACVNFRKESQGFLFPFLARKKGAFFVPDAASLCSPLRGNQKAKGTHVGAPLQMIKNRNFDILQK